MKILILTTFTILVFCQAAEAQTKRIEPGEWIATATKEQHQAITRYILQGDIVAVQRELDMLLLIGEAVIFSGGEQVYLVESSWTGLVRLRRPGKTAAFWTNVEAMGN